ncbi:MAG: rhodanese-like domain-containing protein [Chloroflexaceae bacterium]|jgi:rhodanese-related sulfurtransferase|nr:rhodanese-like domain-containing protein [Chloroflexaceae bacterium]
MAVQPESAAAKTPARSRLTLILVAIALLGGALLVALLLNLNAQPQTAAPAAPANAGQAAPVVPAAPAQGGPLANQAPAAGAENVHGDEAAAAAAPRLEAAEAKTQADGGKAVFVDVRSGSAYAAGHITDALSITQADLTEKLSALPADATIITYCDQPNESASARAVVIFQELGYQNVVALKGGFNAWQSQGLPTAAGK